MDPAKSAGNAPRKVKFAPKAPVKKELKPTLPKVEKVENDIDEAQAQQLLRRLHESSFKEKAKVEKKVGTSQVAFGYGGRSNSIKSFGTPKFMNANQGSSSNGDDITRVAEKQYKEPWDYYTNYPVTLPLRRPYSGNPELLDEEEFGDDTERLQHDEYESNTTVDLSLMEDELEKRMIFLQLPSNMPILKQSSKTEYENQDKNLKNSDKGGRSSRKPCSLEALPAGYMGKMLVYKSGAIKLKLGDTLFDVSAGLDCAFAQDVVAINTEEKHCCSLGELNQRAVLTPDVDSIIESVSDL